MKCENCGNMREARPQVLKVKRLRTYVEANHGFWAGDPIDMGYLSEAERAEIPSSDRILVDPDDEGSEE